VAAFHEIGGGLERHGRHEVLRIEPCGEDSVRVGLGRVRVRDDVPGALLEPAPAPATIERPDAGARLANGRPAVEVTAAGLVRLVRDGTRDELLAEEPAHF
jgi:alpha-D-xyloside xylohydrolase